MAEYDAENVFAKIIDGTIPCFKVFESRASLAFLDINPMVEGHTLVIPKYKGSRTFLDMPPARASDFARDLQRVARAVQEATGATGVNIMSNNGEDAGQTVHHPHFHILPRKSGDNLLKLPPSGAKLEKEQADPLLAKLSAALNPPKPLKKAKFMNVSQVKPDSKGMNLRVKALAEPAEVESKGGKFYEVLCGDETGTVVVSLRDNQKDVVSKDKSVELRNSSVKMVSGHVRVAVDKWGKIDVAEEEVGTVEEATGKNISATEYELVKR